MQTTTSPKAAFFQRRADDLRRTRIRIETQLAFEQKRLNAFPDSPEAKTRVAKLQREIKILNRDISTALSQGSVRA